MTVHLKGVVTGKIGFASHQNAVPVLRELELENAGGETIEDAVLTLEADPPFLEPKNWRIDCFKAGSTLHITERDVKLQAGYLGNLSEAVTGDVVLTLKKGDEVKAQNRFPIEILAKNQWGGCGSMPELLPAFCMPNDSAVDRILKAASDVLKRSGKNGAIDGYEQKSRTRVWELVSAIWSAMAGLNLGYALPPASFETQGQKVRTPGAVLEGGIATCLDSALMFAAALEQASLNPLLILTQGHAFVGVWLQPQEFSSLITEEAAAVRKRIDLQELLVFETTLITHQPVPGFSKAVDQARRQLTDEAFQMAIDVRRARMQRIRPLALPATGAAPAQAEAAPAPVEALEEAPILPGFDVEPELDSASAADKIALWQRKLLDLTTRNRLLHLPESSKCVPLICPDPALLEDHLADGKKIKVLALPDLEAGGRDRELYAQQNREQLHEQYAMQALERGEVVSPLPRPKLEAELIDLYRKSRTDMDEGGANTLFLALGFLKWKKSATEAQTYRAPLLLLPVKLERKSALSGVALAPHEDDPRFNLTLLELLRQDFELKIPGLDGPLPMDESGVDVRRVWNMVRQAVRDVPGFEVSESVVLGTFSFAKYLMWKDLTDRKDQLTQNAVVRHLIERTAGSFCSGSDFPKERDLDQSVNLAKLFAPLPADSSQVAAVVASANGCDFVLVGPPGTGKSQTIANMIAHNLALGRRVLFVAEKMAALNVVHRRLEEKGIGEFCLQLHSNKTSKVDVLKQLERAWDTRDAFSEAEWAREAAEVQQLRDRLNEVVKLLHKTQPNGLTLHQAMGRVIRDGNDATPRLSWPNNTFHDEAALIRLRDISRRLEINLAEVAGVPSGFSLIAVTEWSNTWQDAVAASARRFVGEIDALQTAKEGVLVASQLPLRVIQEEAIRRLMLLMKASLAAHGSDFTFAFVPGARDTISAGRRALAALTEYAELEKQLSTPYSPEAARRIESDRLHAEWQTATQKFWPLVIFARKKVTRALAQQGGASGQPDADKDLPKLQRMRVLLVELDALAATLNGVPGWAVLSSNVAKLAASLDTAESLSQSISSFAASPDHLAEVRAAVRKLVVDANDMLAEGGAISSAVGRLEAQLPLFRAAADQFRPLCGLPDGFVFDLQTLREAAVAIQERQARLKAWCDWRRVRQEGMAAGLQPLIQPLESGDLRGQSLAGLFETAYARWFASALIDAEPRLRNFVAAEHMSDIERYRRLDDHLAKLSVRYIRAKLCANIPGKNAAAKGDGFSILKHELQKQRRHKAVRQLATEMGEAMTRLAPCMLMSPLSIAQFLPVDQQLFDLVIFDEASQITPWDAIGSIARGRQVIIAGDPRQMPPTSFFNRAAAAADDDVEEDMESILDECMAAGIPTHTLTWHYRSRHESLITFSNHRYYDSKLITFPAAVTRDTAVTWRRVKGVYAKGQTRTNQAEAEAMVAEAVTRLRDPAFTGASRSLAIITLNAEQQKLVEDLLDRARRDHPQIEKYFGEEMTEPVVVKNLETVQGDERDLILLGIGYGPTEPGAGVMSMNFGPLNREGGWRRLNVALTRARRDMIVFSSFDSTMVDLNRTSARAVRDLKHFLEFAERGPRALAEAVQGSLGGHESPFEEAVAQRLRDLGWEVIPQIGVSRFRIDLGIVHPDRPGDYLVGIECDGAAYHSAATARDRDKVRAAVLGGLGWTLLRIWSTDWWVDKEGSVERLHASISAILDGARAKVKEAAPSDPPRLDEPPPPEPVAIEEISVPEVPAAPPATAAVTVAVYKLADLAPFTPKLDAERFYEDAYDAVLAELISHVLASEAPIHEGLLVNRIARAHGFKKSGRLIRERVLELVDRHHHLRPDPVGGLFVWGSRDAPATWSAYRTPESEEAIRAVEEIAFEELRTASLAATGQDLAVELARLFGIRRLSSQARLRLEAVLSTP